ncbi:MAG: hexitol phosphatase HxpB [Candidatus Magasanikbacteria bacterium]|nr:hexitol phosphatase HxpB [Candidatus Magasanikbacteria bacterium]
MVGAIIFDMDGLLIDSEPLWRDALVEVFNGVGLSITPEQFQATMGMTTPEVVAYWCAQYASHSKSVEEIIQAVNMTAHRFIAERAVAREGAYEILNFFKEKQLPLAIASSSTMHLIDIVVEKLAIRPYFQVIHSAEFELYGKPYPGVDISTAQKLGVEPAKCLIFEDSWNGVLAAKAALMKCVCVPDENLKGDARLVIADEVISSLLKFDEMLWKKLNT